MKTSVESINSVQKRIKITLPTETVNQAFNSHYRRMRGKVSIKGFRQGKTPLAMVKKLYAHNVSYDVIDQLVKDHLFSVIKKEEIYPISQPYLEMSDAPKENHEYIISAVIDVMAPIELGGKHRGLALAYEHVEASDDQVDKRLEQIARQHSKITPMDEGVACEKGNVALLSYTGSIDEDALPELSAEKTSIELGAGHLPSALMDEALVGMKAGDTKSVDVKFEGENILEKIRNQKVRFSMTLHEVKKLEIPALDDEFAKDSNFDSLADMRAKAKGELQKSADQMNEETVNNGVLKELTGRLEFEVPPSITDQVIDSMIEGIGIRDKEELQKALADKKLREQMIPEAKNRAKNTIALQEVIRLEKIEVTDEDIRAHLETVIVENDAAKKKAAIDRALSLQAGKIREQLIFNKALAFLREHATIEKSTAAKT